MAKYAHVRLQYLLWRWYQTKFSDLSASLKPKKGTFAREMWVVPDSWQTYNKLGLKIQAFNIRTHYLSNQI